LRSKKGISPLIATVLLIGFTIVLAALVFQWGGRLFKDTTTSTTCQGQVSLACASDVQLAISKIVYDYSLEGSITKLEATNLGSSQSIESLVIQRKFADGTIHSIETPVSLPSGSSSSVASLIDSIIFTGTTQPTCTKIDSILVTPTISVTTSDGITCKKTCTEQTQTISNTDSNRYLDNYDTVCPAP